MACTINSKILVTALKVCAKVLIHLQPYFSGSLQQGFSVISIIDILDLTAFVLEDCPVYILGLLPTSLASTHLPVALSPDHCQMSPGKAKSPNRDPPHRKFRSIHCSPINIRFLRHLFTHSFIHVCVCFAIMASLSRIPQKALNTWGSGALKNQQDKDQMISYSGQQRPPSSSPRLICLIMSHQLTLTPFTSGKQFP